MKVSWSISHGEIDENECISVYNGIVDSWEKQADELMKTPQWSKVKDGKKARVSISNIEHDNRNGLESNKCNFRT